jgi:phosphoglycolate phosphatase-like HAD superfamily hydrolase
MRVALFDIDGTILLAHGAGRRAMERALHAAMGSTGPGGQHYAGKTDPQIVREAMRHTGYSDADVDARLAGVLDRYVRELEVELADPSPGAMVVLPGVAALLDACDAHPAVLLGLLTGNLARGAERKLRAVGVDPGRFVIGAFGSDHEDRAVLAALARDRAAARLGTAVAGRECIVIGDTPADVACARAIGARTIGVATGTFAAADLGAAGAEVVFDDLSDTAAVMRAILDE